MHGAEDREGRTMGSEEGRSLCGVGQGIGQSNEQGRGQGRLHDTGIGQRGGQGRTKGDG